MNAMVVREAAWLEPSEKSAERASQMASMIARTRQPTHRVVFLRQRSVLGVYQPLLLGFCQDLGDSTYRLRRRG